VSQKWDLVAAISVAVVASRFVTETDVDVVAVDTHVSISRSLELRVTCTTVPVGITGTCRYPLSSILAEMTFQAVVSGRHLWVTGIVTHVANC